MSAPVSNPAWADKLLATNWADIEAVVKPSWMPRATVGPRGGRRPDRELGCGHYGCVYATGEPGIVCKISSDLSEITFVRAAMKLSWPEGIVRYHATLDLPGQHRSRPVAVLWREEAFKVGHHPYERTYSYLDFTAHLGLFLEAAGEVRKASLLATWPRRLQEAKALEGWAWTNIAWDDDMRDRRSIRAQGRGVAADFWKYTGAKHIAGALRMCEIAAELLENESYAYEVGRALGFYLEHGILLADLHMGNIGTVTRPDYDELRVITDPGHAVFLTA